MPSTAERTQPSIAMALPGSLDTGKRVTVLHLIHSVIHGGIESAVINWVRHIDRSRFNVHLACFANDRNLERPFLEFAESYGLQVLKVPWSRRKPFLKAARAVANLVREHQVDIVHSHAYYADCVGAITGHLVPVKTMTTVYVWGDYELKRKILQWMDQIAIRFMDKVTAHCEDTARGTVKRGIAEDKLTTLIAGFPSKRCEISQAERLVRRRALGVADDEVLLVNVARIHPEKAQDSLLRSFKYIHDRCPKTRLWIVGIGSPKLKQELVALQKGLGLESSVYFLGHVLELSELLALVDMQVHPSRVEGVPIAICYGMCAGLPIVASDVGGIPEVIKGDRTGILVRPGDEVGFAKSVIRLIEHPGEAHLLGACARQFITTDYSMDSAIQRLQNTYYEVLGR